MLNGKVVKIRKRVRRMDDPMPEFVSVVPGGSNTTPIRAMKADDIQEIDVAQNLKRGDVAIARFAFTGTAFKSEDDVRTWLTAGGYDIPAIVTVKGENFDGYTVASKEQPENLTEIDLGNGVTAFVAVGVKAEDISDPRGHVTDQGAEAPIKTGAQAAKGDSLEGDGTNETTTSAQQPEAAAPAASDPAAAPADTAATKSDTVAPAAPGPAPSLIRVDENGIPSLVAQKGVYDITQLAEVLQALTWCKDNVAYAVYNGTYSDAIASAYNTLISQIGALIQEITGAVVAQATKSEGASGTDIVSEADQTVEQVIDDTLAAPAAKEEATGTEPGEGGEAHQNGSTTTAEPAAKNEDPMSQLTALVNTLATAVQGLAERVEKSETKADEAISGVRTITGTAPARRSADVDDLAAASPTSQPKQAQKSDTDRFRDQNAANLMGMRGPLA